MLIITEFDCICQMENHQFFVKSNTYIGLKIRLQLNTCVYFTQLALANLSLFTHVVNKTQVLIDFSKNASLLEYNT